MAINPTFTEFTRVQIPALIHLARLGYDYLPKNYFDSDEKLDSETNIATEIFREKFCEFNPDVEDDEFANLFQNIKLELGEDNLGENFYNRLVSKPSGGGIAWSTGIIRRKIILLSPTSYPVKIATRNSVQISRFLWTACHSVLLRLNNLTPSAMVKLALVPNYPALTTGSKIRSFANLLTLRSWLFFLIIRNIRRAVKVRVYFMRQLRSDELNLIHSRNSILQKNWQGSSIRIR